LLLDQELLTPAFLADPFSQIHAFFSQQIAVYLVLYGYVSFEEPGCYWIIGHLLFGYSSWKTVVNLARINLIQTT
jgi:hypothetical protein